MNSRLLKAQTLLTSEIINTTFAFIVGHFESRAAFCASACTLSNASFTGRMTNCKERKILSLNFLWCYCSTAEPNLQANPRRGLIPSSQKSHCPHQTRLSVLGRLFPRKKGCHCRPNTIDTKFNKGLVGISRKRKIKKGPSPKISLLVQIGEQIWAPVCSDDSAQILLKLAQIITLTMETSEHNVAYISWPNCTNRLIFGKGAFLILFFLDMLTNPIISQIWIFVTSQFSSL